MAHAAESIRNYLRVWAILMILLVATVLAGWLVHREPWGILVAMTIAVVKAVLVVLFFMHLKDAPRLTWVFASAAFLWLGIMIVLTLSDYATRGTERSTQIIDPQLQAENQALYRSP